MILSVKGNMLLFAGKPVPKNKFTQERIASSKELLETEAPLNALLTRSYNFDEVLLCYYASTLYGCLDSRTKDRN